MSAGPSTVYLAARYSRRDELRDYRRELEAAGYPVRARWLDGDHEISGRGDGPDANRDRVRFAMEDWEDVTRATFVIVFTEEPRSTNGRGGRHVEFGIALGRGTHCVVIGPLENVFHYLPWISNYPSWEAFRETWAVFPLPGKGGGS